MTAAKYTVSKRPGDANLWIVVRSVPYIAGTPASHSNSHLGHATTLSGAVALAEEHKGDKIAWTWADNFESGEGQ